jgi:hypothetical protein
MSRRSFARFDGQGSLLLVIANFRPGAPAAGKIRVPPELAAAVLLIRGS